MSKAITIINHGPQFNSPDWFMFYCPECSHTLEDIKVTNCPKCNESIHLDESKARHNEQ